MKLPKEGNVKCPKTGEYTNIEYCKAHCLSVAKNPKGWVCMEDMTQGEIDKDIEETYTKEELEGE